MSLAACFLVICTSFLISGARCGGTEDTSAQAVFTLPRDLATHGNAAFYSSHSYEEWMYVAGFFKDVDTGEELSIFLAHFWAAAYFAADSGGPWRGRDPGEAGAGLAGQAPMVFTVFSTSNMGSPSGDLHSTLGFYFGTPFRAEGSGPDDSPFWFEHGANGIFNSFRTSYNSSDEAWTWSASKTTLLLQRDFALNLSGNVFSPGYLSPPTGLEPQGLDYRFDPQSMEGLSYYIFAPNMVLAGTLEVREKVRRVRGIAWHEHQWGNFMRDSSAFHYIWGYARFKESGDLLTLRQWCRPGFDCDIRLNRYAFLKRQADGSYSVEHAAGPTANYTPTGFFEASNGARFPVNGTLRTPQGTWFVVPDHANQTASTPAGPFWEGVTYLRSGSSEGPKVARAFFELVDYPPGLELGGTAGGGAATTGGRPPLPDLGGWLQ